MPYPPYRPPWYPHDDNPGEIISNMSDNVVTRYSKWVASLPPGRLLELIHEHHVTMGHDCNCQHD